MQKHYFNTVLDCFKVMLFLIFLETSLQLYAKFKILYFFILCENFFDFVRKATRSDKYYLLIVDDKKDLEVLRQEVMIDIAFADDFGF